MKLLLAAFLALASGSSAVLLAVEKPTANNHLTMNQWVHLTADGSLNGRVLFASAEGQASTLSGINVSLRDRDGTTFTAQTDERGKFKINGIQPGIYALIARGANAFASAALHLLPVDEKSADGFPAVAEISAAKIQDTTVQMAIARYLPPNLQRGDASIDRADLEQLASHVYGSELSQVQQIGGGMKGKIFLAGAEGTDLRAAGRTNVFLFQNGFEVARALTDQDGQFRFERLPIGYYSLLAIGRDGLGSIGFVLVDQEQARKTAKNLSAAKDAETLVMQYGCCGVQDGFAMQIAPVPDAVQIVQNPMVLDVACITGCGVPIPACGCGPCCGTVVEGVPVEGKVSETSPAEGKTSDGEPAQREVADSSGIAQGGYAGYSGGFGGGGGGGGAGGGLGGLGSLGALGGVLATTAGGGGASGAITAPISPPVSASAGFDPILDF